MAVKDHRRSDRLWFYKIGISGDDTINGKGWIMKTLPSIIKSMNDSDASFLTIDSLPIQISERSMLMDEEVMLEYASLSDASKCTCLYRYATPRSEFKPGQDTM